MRPQQLQASNTDDTEWLHVPNFIVMEKPCQIYDYRTNEIMTTKVHVEDNSPSKWSWINPW